MKNTALWLMLCGCMAFVSSPAIADTVAVKTVTSSDAQSDDDKPVKFTTDQLEKMHSIKEKYEDASAVRGVETHRLHRQIFDTLAQASVDKSAMLAIQGKINALEAEQSNDRIQMMVDIHDILTQEQRTAMRRHMLEHDMPGPGHNGMRPREFGGAGMQRPGAGAEHRKP